MREYFFYVIVEPAYGFISLSAVFFYRSVFVKGANSRFDRVSKISLAIVIIWTITFFLAKVFKCGAHVPRSWDPFIDAGYCADGDKIANGLYC